MIEKFIKVKDGLSYLLGNIDSAGRSRRSEIVGGCFLPAVKEARKVASKFKEPEVTFSYRDPNPKEKIGGQEFEDELQELILQTFLPGLDRSKFNYLFIRHHNPDKSYELNFYWSEWPTANSFLRILQNAICGRTNCCRECSTKNIPR